MIASIISQICFMKVIQLHLPDELAEKVLAITGNVETYILDVLRTNINEPKKPKHLLRNTGLWELKMRN